MRAMMRFCCVGMVLGSLLGCTTTIPVPLVSDVEDILARERARDQPEQVNPANKLKNLSVAQHLEQGREALLRGDTALSGFHFTLALAKDDKLLEGYLGLAESLIREKKYQSAEAVLEKALQVDDACVPAMARLGMLYRVLENNTEALRYLRKAGELDPDNAWLLTELAITIEKAGGAFQAEEYFWKSLELLPESAEALNNLGFNLLVQEKYGTAVPLLEKALRLDPGSKLARNNLALAYAFDGKHRQAFQAFESTVGAAGAYNNLGYLLMLQKQDGDAEKALSKAMELNPVFYARAKENLELLRGTAHQESRLFD